MTDLFSHADGLALGHASAAVAADHAGADWIDRAYAAFVAYAKRGQPFTTEDVRNANPDLPAPPDPRAWGQVALRAKKRKLVAPGEMVRAKNRGVHGQMVRQWAPL